MAQEVISKGWECPKCCKVYAPTQLECTKCPIPTTYASTGNVYVNGTSSTIMGHEFKLKLNSTIEVCDICGLEKWRHPIIQYL